MVVSHSPARSAVSHVVISEIQVAGIGTGHANDEFVELYNPTDNAIDLTNFRLTRKTAGGTASILVSNLSGSIASHHFFLIANPLFTAIGITPDALYSSTSRAITSDNTIILSGSDHTTVIDKVGFGSATDFEGSVFPSNPVNGGSLERKAFSTSTTISMEVGGSDEFLGNGQDSDNNANDFILRDTSQPQNSLSSPEPPDATVTPLPSLTPTSGSTETPSPTQLPPTEIPSSTPSPTLTDIPSPTPSNTPTPIPSPVPTSTPIPTSTPTPPLPTPTATVSPTPIATPIETDTPTPLLTHPTPTPTYVPSPTPQRQTPTPPLLRREHHDNHFFQKVWDWCRHLPERFHFFWGKRR